MTLIIVPSAKQTSISPISIMPYLFWYKRGSIKNFIVLISLCFLALSTAYYFKGEGLILFCLSPMLIATVMFNQSYYMFYSCFLKYSDIKLSNISLSCLKPYFKSFFYISSVLFLIALFSGFYLATLDNEFFALVPYIFSAIQIIVLVIFEGLMVMVIKTEFIKNNVDIKNIDDQINDMRGILYKHLINSN